MSTTFNFLLRTDRIYPSFITKFTLLRPTLTSYKQNELRHEKTNILQMRKQRRRSASRLPRARKLYTSARIYEWKLGKGEWKFPIARPTGRVDFFGCSLLVFLQTCKN